MAALVRLSIALRLRFWKYSYAEPWRPFVPVFVTRLNWPPEECPVSALNWLVCKVNSATESGITVEFGPVTPRLLSSTPSTVKLFSRGRVHPTDPQTPVSQTGGFRQMGSILSIFCGVAVLL